MEEEARNASNDIALFRRAPSERGRRGEGCVTKGRAMGGRGSWERDTCGDTRNLSARMYVGVRVCVYRCA